jgi:hypothetical protein
MIPVKSIPDLIHDFEDNIFQVENALTDEVCDNLISEIEKNMYEGKPTGWLGHWSKGLLDNNHYIHDNLQTVWEKAVEFYDCKIDFVEPYHIKKYDVLNFYGAHTDSFGSITKRLDRRLSLVVQLSHEQSYESGELVIAGTSATKKRGSAIFFPSTFTHQVNRVKKGKRYSLITWGWGNIFK